SPVKNFFGIKSPSRTMRDEVGKMIPQGLAIGIEAESDTAISAMDDLSASLIAEPVKISSPENLKSLYGTNSDNVSRETSTPQINLNVSDVKLSGVEDIQQFAKELAKEFEREMSLCI
ncbi:MAG: hypothetical protein ACRDD4_12735, partial [Culicoidibacterales bacterium]